MQRIVMNRRWMSAIWSIIVVVALLVALSPVPAAAECNGNTSQCTAYTCSGNLYCASPGSYYDPCHCYGQPSCFVVCGGDGQWHR